VRLYADASALVKLVVTEPESAALARAIPADADVVTSAVSVVEVSRAAKLAELEDDTEPDPDALLAGCTLVDVDLVVLRQAAGVASRSLRTLDAIHLATAIRVSPDAFVTYDRQLGRAARAAGLRLEAPGAEA
jgi:predicted nucleic acid-binding protein